jgi:hypothetical protein
MAEDTQPTAPSAQAQAPATPPAGASPTETPAQEQTVPYARFREINEQLKALKDEADKQAKTARKAEEERLATQNEWQQLAETRKATIDELTGFAELASQLSEQAASQYEAEIAEWPEQVRGMAPADDASILEKMAWMNKAKPLALELLKDKTPIPGNGIRPKPIGAAGVVKADEKARDEWTRQASHRYR